MRVLSEIGVAVLMVVLELVAVALICSPKGVARAVRRAVEKWRARRAEKLRAAELRRW
jgi:hypothetical protein